MMSNSALPLSYPTGLCIRPKRHAQFIIFSGGRGKRNKRKAKLQELLDLSFLPSWAGLAKRSKSAHEGKRSWDLHVVYWEGFFIPSPPSPPGRVRSRRPPVIWSISRSNRFKTASRRHQDEKKTTR